LALTTKIQRHKGKSLAVHYPHNLARSRYSRVEESVRVAVAESYLAGVATRKVETVFSEFGLKNVSPSEVSRISKKLDKQVQEFLNRPIEGPIPYLFLDASYFKVRDEGRDVNKALLIVTGIHDDGYREILNAEVADGEDAFVGRIEMSAR